MNNLTCVAFISARNSPYRASINVFSPAFFEQFGHKKAAFIVFSAGSYIRAICRRQDKTARYFVDSSERTKLAADIAARCVYRCQFPTRSTRAKEERKPRLADQR